MIKINLSNAKKQLDISNVGGFDFTKLKIKPLLLVIAIIYVPDFFFVPMWEEEIATVNQQMSKKQAKLSGLKREVSKTMDLDKKIRELKAQEENLVKKLTAVKQAISEKKNPSSILLYLAKNIPPELWITELDINLEQMTIKGEALDYTSIGNFVNSLRSSVFIREANIASTKSAVRESDKRRIESFEVKFSIARFDQ
jgi:Tfp pilus assembly protein PilN